MFYNDTMNDLRFGDVVKGFILSSPAFSNNPLEIKKYDINMEQPEYCVLMTPCCSIKNKIISLAPLQKINKKWLNNPYLKEDLTRINRVMSPENSYPPVAWEHMSDEEKMKKLAEGTTYAFYDTFIYEGNDLFSKYCINQNNEEININVYMINFKDIYRIKCQNINSNAQYPDDIKCLELTPETRKELRDKLVFFYSRVPDEDKPFIEDNV